MTDIEHERKRRLHPAWLWVLAAAAVVAVFGLWWQNVADIGDDTRPDPVSTTPPAEEHTAVDRLEPPGTAPPPATASERERAEPTDGAQNLPIAAILDAPEQWKGRTVSGVARITSVRLARGFWIEANDRALFVVVHPRSGQTRFEPQPGSWIRIDAARVRAGDDRDALEGEAWRDTREILANQRVFLVVDEASIEALQA